mgnify:CR=1 FL=1
MKKLNAICLTAMKLLGISWLFIASFAILDVLYHESSNNEYLKACLRYHKGMMMVLDDEDADKIRLEFLPGSDTHDLASLMMSRFYKDNAYAWQQCMGKPH